MRRPLKRLALLISLLALLATGWLTYGQEYASRRVDSAMEGAYQKRKQVELLPVGGWVWAYQQSFGPLLSVARDVQQGAQSSPTPTGTHSSEGAGCQQCRPATRPVARQRAGQLLLVPREDWLIEYHYLGQPRAPSKKIGQHAGLSPEEMLVPLLAARLE